MSKHRRSRVRHIAKWAGLVACVTLLLAGISGFYRVVGYFGPRGQVFLNGGGVFVSSRLTAGSRGFKTFNNYSFPPREFWQRVRNSFWLPDVRSGGIWVPLWPPLLLVGAGTAFLWYRDRRRVLPGCCRQCGYDLTGNVSGRCPECGTPCNIASGGS